MSDRAAEIRQTVSQNKINSSDKATKMNPSKLHLAIPLIALAMSMPTEAFAQDRPPGFEPLSIAPDINGVDLLSGQITFPLPPLQIPADPLLSFGRIQDYSLLLNGTVVSTSNFTQILSALNSGNYSQADQLMSQSIQQRTVKIYAQIGDSVSESFDCSDGDCTSRSAMRSYMLEGSGGGYFIYRQGGTGKTVIYNLRYAALTSSYGLQFSYYGSQIKYADGETHDIEYDLAQYPGPQNITLNARRPAKVKSNRGFELRITYASADPYNNGWGLPASAAIFRRGEYATPLSSMTFPNGGAATDQMNNTWLGEFRNGLGSSSRTPAGSYRPPTNTTDQIVASSTASDIRGPLLTSINKGGDVWNYAWSHATSASASNYGTRYVTITGPNGYYRKATIVDGALTFPRIASEVDGLNRTINYTYMGKQLTGITFPEGNKISLTYDLLGNVTQKQSIAKPSSGAATITESAAYSPDSNCPTEAYVYCFRPIWTKDGKNNQTDYTWDQQHGGMLTETGPADGNGIRPQRRIEYTERFAWFKDDNGTFVRSPTGIFLKTRETVCKATATVGNICAGGATDEVVTDYDYGLDSGPNYLLLRGITVTASGSSGALETLRTCFTYDAQGRKISETQPMGTGSTCP